MVCFYFDTILNKGQKCNEQTFSFDERIGSKLKDMQLSDFWAPWQQSCHPFKFKFTSGQNNLIRSKWHTVHTNTVLSTASQWTRRNKLLKRQQNYFQLKVKRRTLTSSSKLLPIRALSWKNYLALSMFTAAKKQNQIWKTSVWISALPCKSCRSSTHINFVCSFVMDWAGNQSILVSHVVNVKRHKDCVQRHDGSAKHTL